MWTLSGSDWPQSNYDLTFTSQMCRVEACEEAERPERWRGNLARIGENIFLDITPKGENSGDPNWVPAHTFYRIKLTADNLQISFMDHEWLDRAIALKQLRLAHYHLGSALAGNILLIDSSAVLRKLLLDFGNDPEAFPPENTVVFERANPGGPGH